MFWLPASTRVRSLQEFGLVTSKSVRGWLIGRMRLWVEGIGTEDFHLLGFNVKLLKTRSYYRLFFGYLSNGSSGGKAPFQLSTRQMLALMGLVAGCCTCYCVVSPWSAVLMSGAPFEACRLLRYSMCFVACTRTRPASLGCRLKWVLPNSAWISAPNWFGDRL